MFTHMTQRKKICDDDKSRMVSKVDSQLIISKFLTVYKEGDLDSFKVCVSKIH